jgi:protein deglycase
VGGIFDEAGAFILLFFNLRNLRNLRSSAERPEARQRGMTWQVGLMKKHVLCLMADGFEEIEMIAPVDLLRRAGVKVTIASLKGGPATGKCGVTVQPDVALHDVEAGDFDMLLIPGGPGVMALREDGRPKRLAADFYAEGKPVAAICAAPLVLKDAGLLGGRRFTSHFSVHEDLPGVVDERVVEDGLLITSRGAGTALEFGLALVRRLAGESAADEVAASVMA